MSVNQKHTNLDKCEKQGMELHLLMKEYNINKYRFACVDATDYKEF